MHEESITGHKGETNRHQRAEYSTIPVVKEDVAISKEERVTGEVTVRTSTETKTVNVPLSRTVHGYREVRVPAGRVVEEMPAPRQEDGRYIIPVVREEEVVIKRLVLVEEVHLIPDTTTEQRTEEVELRSQTVSVERTPPPE
jgi:stress response protein YsnF